MKTLLIKTIDAITLTAHLFEPISSNGQLIIINSATGVRQNLYFGIANYLSENGFTVLTYDYRGIGLSKPKKLKGFNATMRDWGTKDFAAITQYLNQNFTFEKKYILGHSVGALILGMNKDSLEFDKFIFVATQKAHVSNLNWKIKLMGYGGFGILQPLVTSVLGYYPAQWFGLGETLPKGVAYDWRTLILDSKSTNRLLEKVDHNYSSELDQETFIISAEDDAWVTQKGIRTLLEETYPNLQPTIHTIRASESEKGNVGHINFFRKYNKKLWKMIIDNLNH